jgi:hypothetical protein
MSNMGYQLYIEHRFRKQSHQQLKHKHEYLLGSKYLMYIKRMF